MVYRNCEFRLNIDAHTHRYKEKLNSDIVLVPQPTDDVNDPLNWPHWKKALAFGTTGMFTFLVVWILGGIGAAMVLLMNEFGTDLDKTVHGVISWAVLTIGLAVSP